MFLPWVKKSEFSIEFRCSRRHLNLTVNAIVMGYHQSAENLGKMLQIPVAPTSHCCFQLERSNVRFPRVNWLA